MKSFTTCVALLAGFALLTPAGRAAVVYRWEVNPIGHSPTISFTSAPVDPSDPLYRQDAAEELWLLTSKEYYLVDPATGNFSTSSLHSNTVQLGFSSIGAFVGGQTSDRRLYVLGVRNRLWQLDLNPDKTTTIIGPQPGLVVPVGTAYSMAAANRTNFTMIADERFVSFDINTGEVTEHFAITGGIAPGEFGLDTHYHSYAPNGLVYLLDTDNNRMQMLDPANAFAYAGEFTLQPGVANMQFGIGPNSDVYLGDGAGGGFSYSALGVYQGVFTPPQPSETPGLVGRPYVTADALGNVYVFDNSGGHQYTAVPEPGVVGLFTSAVLVGLRFERHRSRQRKGTL